MRCRPWILRLDRGLAADMQRSFIPALPFFRFELTAPKPKTMTYPKEMKVLGDHVRKRRLDLCLLQREVGERLGADLKTLVSWERQPSEPSFRHLPAIVAFLGYDPDPRVRHSPNVSTE